MCYTSKREEHSEVRMLASILATLSFDEILSIIGLVVNSLQALVLPITIYLLVVQTRAMRVQTTALVEQSKEKEQ